MNGISTTTETTTSDQTEITVQSGACWFHAISQNTDLTAPNAGTPSQNHSRV